MDYANEVKEKDAKRLLSAIRHQREILREKQRHWDEAKRVTKQRRDEVDRARERLEFLADKPRDDDTPLIDMMDGEGWRSVPLAHVLSAKYALKIEQQLGFRALGQLCDWQKEKHLSELKGWGDETAAAVADEMLQFWIDHPEFTQPGSSDDEAA